MRDPKPFTVYQPIAGQSAKPLFTVHAYSIKQARTIVATKVAGETVIVGPIAQGGASQ
jgi:hypothetical protein